MSLTARELVLSTRAHHLWDYRVGWDCAEVGGMDSVEQVRARVGELAGSAWTLAAVAAFLQLVEGGLPEEHGAVLAQAGLAHRDKHGDWVPVTGLAALRDDPNAVGSLNLVGNLRQMVAAASGTTGWANQDDATLRAQGDASAALAPAFLSVVAPKAPDLATLLGEPEAIMLDVGTGTGGIPAGLCSAIPTLRVVGIDVLPTALAMARDRVAAAQVANRVEFRQQDVVDLTDREVFDVAWVPTIFMSPAAVLAALPRVRDALRPGGMLIIGTPGYQGATRSDAITAWRVVSDGGTPWTSTQMAEAAAAAGFVDVDELPALPGSAAFVIARRTNAATCE